MSNGNDPGGYHVGNTDRSKRGLDKIEKNLKKLNKKQKSGCLTSLFIIVVLAGGFYSAIALTLGLFG